MANIGWKSMKGIPLVVTLIWIAVSAAALHFMEKSVIAFLGILFSIILIYYTNTDKRVRLILGAAVLLLIIPLVAGTTATIWKWLRRWASMWRWRSASTS